ncbi:Calcineurin-like phosphoesterase superfamily domain protein [bacterium YEK0313]|nr:Calcineurin-like phosphoesterase superfamily domain protein [bacterium YEK0313]
MPQASLRAALAHLTSVLASGRSPRRGTLALALARLDRLKSIHDGFVLLPPRAMGSGPMSSDELRPPALTPIVDPRFGDVEDDALATKRRSLLSLAGTLFAEISLPKLIAAWFVMIIGPGIMLGLAPQVALGWAIALKTNLAAPFAGLGALVLLLIVALAGWYGIRPLFRAAESNFWQLNSLAVQPFYAACREALRHFAEKLLPTDTTEAGRARLRAATSVAAGLVLSGLALSATAAAWRASSWIGEFADLASPYQLAKTALANSVVLIGLYLAAVALVWSIADALMPQPRALQGFATADPTAGKAWRVAHLSDLHGVGEPYGLRIESGRSGPRGNGRIAAVLQRLDALHAAEPLDLILLTGDTTDAGRSAEWAAFFDLLAAYPHLAERMLVLPGNHDVNVVDRTNPARLDLPMSPAKRLRQLRMLSAMAAIQGSKVHLVDRRADMLGPTLAATLAPRLSSLAEFSDTGSWREAGRFGQLWPDLFPQVLPPREPDGLGVILADSNAETHFSFTNALGLVSAEQALAIEKVLAAYPGARWIIALHHHLVEYPMPARALSERIGTALINGSWFVRRLSHAAHRIVAMHGHRHIDWIGECAGLTIVSAPSPVMEATDAAETCFYIHTLVATPDGGLGLGPPERIAVAGAAACAARAA